MEAQDRMALFETELSFIRILEIRTFVKYCLTRLPDYFFQAVASSSGKYHPSYALGEGGLVRHTKAAVRIAHELINADVDEWYMYDSDFGELVDKYLFDDEVYAALILHDGMKLGVVAEGEDWHGKHTVHEHPLLMSEMVMQWGIEEGYASGENIMSVKRIASAISSHMGKWVYSKYSSVVLPSPMGWQSRLVHIADMLASRRCLEFNFAASEANDV